MRTNALLAVLLSSSFMASAQTPLLRWTFDEASGPVLDSGSGTASSGTLQGNAVRAANTPSGSGFSVDFRNEPPTSYVLGEDAAKLDGLSQLTVSTWLNLSSYTSGNNRLAAKQAGGAFGGFNWSMNATPNSGAVGPDNWRMALFLGNNIDSSAANFGAAYSTDDVGAANRWVFLAVTYDNTVASGNVHFYMGDATTPVSLVGSAVTLPQLTIEAGTARFGVGFTDAAPTANTSAIGLQDDVRVYGVPLTLAQLDAVRLEAIPEPTSFALLGFALAGLVVVRRNR